MAFKKLTTTGENFIKGIAKKLTASQGADAMIRGRATLGGKPYNLPFSDKQNDPIVHIWVCDITNFDGTKVTTNDQFAEYLITSFNNNASSYGIDANIMAAQGFQESAYKAWNYPKTSTAAGISQFLMLTIYDVIYNRRLITGTDKAKLIKNMELPDYETSWIGVVGKGKYTALDRTRQYKNHSILHQNVCDNPDVIIKAQCAFMNWITGRNNDLASSTLYAYSRGSGYKSKNYVELVNFVAKNKGNKFSKDGTDYVNKIFAYLGDKDNTEVSLDPITKGLWFGYDINFEKSTFEANLG